MWKRYVKKLLKKGKDESNLNWLGHVRYMDDYRLVKKACGIMVDLTWRRDGQ